MRNIFFITVSAATVIKAKNIAHITPSINQKTQQLNIQPSRLKLVKLSYLVGSVDRKNIFPNDFLVPNIFNTATFELFIIINHAVKHKKTMTT